MPWISSTFLNPLLFWYFKKTTTKASFLFQCLAVTDFLTNIFSPLIYSYLMLSPKIFSFASNVATYARTWACIIGCLSQVTGFLLAATRAIKIIFPFSYLRQMYIKLYLGGYIIYMILNNGTYFIIEVFYGEKEWQKKMLKIGLDLCFWANFAHCCIGVFISVFTIIYLYFSTRQNPNAENSKYITSCITILLINIPYIFSIISIVLVWWVLPDQLSFHEIIFAWIPIITSGLNPIIILSRKRDARKALVGIFLPLVKGTVLTEHSTSRISTQRQVSKPDKNFNSIVVANNAASEV
ncbi:hypothetical protein ACHWQZ_G007954 [Mnemiopsis leidyi]